jgi:signal transduction histidine kinase
MAHRLLSSIAHDLGSPITGLLGLIHLLESGVDGPLNEAQKARLDRIRATAESIADIAGGIRDLVVLESGKVELDREEVDLARLLESVARSLEKRARGQAVELRLALSPDLPALLADPGRLRQVVTILVSSAMRQAGGSVLEIQATADGPLARVTLRETSRAIPAEALPAEFREEETLSEEPSPAPEGLHMSLARGLIELHGGALTTRDRDRGDVIARFTLPARAIPPLNNPDRSRSLRKAP